MGVRSFSREFLNLYNRKYAHINLSLMMSPPVDRSQNEKKFVKTKPQRTSKPKLTF